MRTIGLLFLLGLLAAAIFVPPRLGPRETRLRVIDEHGLRDEPCPREFAYVEEPQRARPTLDALFEDFAYAAAAARPEGCLAMLAGVALVALVTGLWCSGVRCGLRRVLVTFALGVPLCMWLLYASCFLEGRRIRLGPAASSRFVLASLHNQTDRSTGLVSPSQLVTWHAIRGFRVLNVSDRDSIEAAREAQRHAVRAQIYPPLLVLAGEEWHGRPHLVLLNIRRTFSPELSMEETIAGVRREGGAVFLAHPWAKVAPRRLDQVLSAGADGVEIVNGVIHGGRHVLATAQRLEKSLVGVLDYKYGPHVNAVTLVPRQLAKSARGVVTALRERRTRVLYAVPGGTITGAVWEALGTSGAMAGLSSLYETPHARRATWFLWLGGIAVLWWLATRAPRKKRLGQRTARILLIVFAAFELALPLGVWWELRARLGTIPVTWLLFAAALFAIPLLAATHSLALKEREG